jgi:hypothetical protein
MTAEKQRVLYCDLFTDSCRFCVDSVNLKREGEGRLFDCDLFQHLSAPLLGAVRQREKGPQMLPTKGSDPAPFNLAVLATWIERVRALESVAVMPQFFTPFHASKNPDTCQGLSAGLIRIEDN